MASSRATTSAVSLDDWESLAPLSERSKASVALITEASSERALPPKLARTLAANNAAGATPHATRPGTPSNSTLNNFFRRAASRADLSSSIHSSAPGSPSGSGSKRVGAGGGGEGYFTPDASTGHGAGEGRRHARTISSSSALAMSVQITEPSSSMNGLASALSVNGQTNGLHEEDYLDLPAPVETTQQFLDWFGKIEASMESEQEHVYQIFRSELETYIESCQEALEMLEDSRGLIKEMEANYKFVEDNSKALQIACETMLDDQKHLVEVTDAIDARLEYFRELEVATRALSQPGDAVVLQEDFLGMLERLDGCLDFLRHNRNYRDAEVYLIRFQQCQTRAMTLIKMHFLSVLSGLQSEIAARLSTVTSRSGGKAPVTASLSETALHALLYSKFSTIPGQTKSLVYELEKRAQTNPDEYGSLLQECFAQWFAVRNQLLAPNLAEEVRRMEPATTDLVKLARSGCAYLRNVCSNEWSLFRELFSITGQSEVYHYLESLCDNLYDSLRPRILHETKLEVLCELCSILQALISLDGDAEEDDDGGGAERGADSLTAPALGDTTIEGESSFDISVPAVPPLDREGGSEGVHAPVGRKEGLRFSTLLGTVLQDAQTRLVFRAQYVVEAEVLHYAPKPEDLEYPEKLRLAKTADIGKGGGASASAKGKTRERAQAQEEYEHAKAEASRMGVAEEDGMVVFKLPSEEIMQNWYPTLRKTLWILSKLHSYVNTAIFEDFAGEAVTFCRQSLTIAAEKISARPGASKLDGQLFVIRHLLILKDMVRSIDLVQVERAFDFSSMTDALSSLLRNTSTLFNPNALFQLASKGIPSFTETMRDAKHDLDGTLKLVCEDFMTQSSLLVSSSILAFLNRCQAFLASNPASAAGGGGEGGPDLTAQPWATAEEVLKLHESFVAEGEGMERGMREVLSKLSLFLDEEDTIRVLVPPTQAEVLEHYTTFYNLVRQEYDFSTASALTPPGRIRERLRAIAGQESDRGFVKSREG